MKYPSHQARKARPVFTAKLQSIFRRLDSCATRELSAVFIGERTSSVITVEEVWVVGSYARGAVTCGDLDLVVRTTGGYATSGAVNRALLGQLPDVRVYCGTPDANASGIPFPEAVKVWEAGMDWAAALAAIQENASATRFPRRSDVIPFRLEQICIGVDDAERLVTAFESGKITWRFTPLDAICPVSVQDKKLLEWVSIFRTGKAKQKLLPYVQGYLNSLGYDSTYSVGCFDDDVWTKDDIRVWLGRVPCISELNNPGISRIAMMPELNTRGPNGIWTIERGPEHPITKLFGDEAAGWLVSTEGKPHNIAYGDGQWRDRCNGLEVFGSRADAIAHIELVYDDDYVEECGARPDPLYVKGHEFLQALRGIELLEFPMQGKMLAFNFGAAITAKGFDAEYPKSIPNWLRRHWAEYPTVG